MIDCVVAEHAVQVGRLQCIRSNCQSAFSITVRRNGTMRRAGSPHSTMTMTSARLGRASYRVNSNLGSVALRRLDRLCHVMQWTRPAEMGSTRAAVHLGPPGGSWTPREAPMSEAARGAGGICLRIKFDLWREGPR